MPLQPSPDPPRRRPAAARHRLPRAGHQRHAHGERRGRRRGRRLRHDQDHALRHCTCTINPPIARRCRTRRARRLRSHGAHFGAAQAARRESGDRRACRSSFTTQATRDTMRVLSQTTVRSHRRRPSRCCRAGGIHAGAIDHRRCRSRQPARRHDHAALLLEHPDRAGAGRHRHRAASRTVWRAATAARRRRSPTRRTSATSRASIRSPRWPPSKPIPMLVIGAECRAGCAGVKPAAGWPVVIFQHGITRDRGTLALSRMPPRRGFVIVGIDLRLHGVMPNDAAARLSPTNPANAALPAPSESSARSTSTT